MNRRHFVYSMAILPGIALRFPVDMENKNQMNLHFLRHATFVLELNGVRLLVDPMLSAKDAMEPVGDAANTDRIPMMPLPLDQHALKALLQQVDAVVVTHMHRDHWDGAAQALIRKDMTLLCQPSDEVALRDQGFTAVLPVNTSTGWKDLRIHRTGGRHGTGDVGLKMGHVSGFVIERGEKKIYIAGDTIWCEEVAHALATHRPQFIVLNAGAAHFLQGGPITMTAADVVQVCRSAPAAKVIAVHMETVNHCLLTRDALKGVLTKNRLMEQCLVPADGEWVAL